jgi:very-short-patch-repair endonuclease
MEELLRGIGVDFKREFVIFHSNDTRFVIVDFWLPRHLVALECDGSAHDLQKKYDAGRDALLASQGVRTLRSATR